MDIPRHHQGIPRNHDEHQEKIAQDQKLLVVPTDKVLLNSDNPRRNFDETALLELTRSVRNQGVLQPIIVRRWGSRFQVVAGERRYRASVAAGLKEIPVIVREFDDKETLEVALVENLQRENLNPIEEAETYKRFLTEFKYTQETLANFLGKDRTTISNTVRLLKLPDEVRDLLVEGRISQGHARAILGLNDPKRQVELAQQCIEQGWSVRQIERTVKNEKKLSSSRRKSAPSYIDHMEQNMSDLLQAPVKIRDQDQRGTITIEFSSVDDFERILGIITRGAEQKSSLEEFLRDAPPPLENIG